MLANPHSTGRLNLAAKMTIIGKIMVRVFTNAPCLDSPSSGEFIRKKIRPKNIPASRSVSFPARVPVFHRYL